MLFPVRLVKEELVKQGMGGLRVLGVGLQRKG